LSARLLADGRSLTLRERRTCEGVDSWTILLPGDLPPQLDTVIAVDIAEEQVCFEPITGSWRTGDERTGKRWTLS